MIDLLLVAGVALCAIAVVMAIAAVARTRAPRGAAVVLVLGVVAIIAGGALDDRPLGLASLTQSWDRLVSGEGFGTDTVTAPPPAVSTAEPVTEAPALAEPAPPGVEEPAEVGQTTSQ